MSRYIAADTIRLFYDSPAFRRAQLDSLVRRLIPEAAVVYRQYDRVRDHRRVAVKSGQALDSLPIYDAHWIRLSGQILAYRKRILAQLQAALNACDRVAAVTNDATLDLVYVYGGGYTADYNSALQASITPGPYYTIGPHTDDFYISLNGRSSVQYYSRGINRMLALLLSGTEQRLINTAYATRSIMLLDDPFIELDAANKSIIMRYFKDQFYAIYATVDSTHQFGPADEFQVHAGDVSIIAKSPIRT